MTRFNGCSGCAVNVSEKIGNATVQLSLGALSVSLSASWKQERELGDSDELELEFKLQITATPRPPQTAPVPAWLKWVGAGIVAVGGAVTSAGEACVAVECEVVLAA